MTSLDNPCVRVAQLTLPHAVSLPMPSCSSADGCPMTGANMFAVIPPSCTPCFSNESHVCSQFLPPPTSLSFPYIFSSPHPFISIISYHIALYLYSEKMYFVFIGLPPAGAPPGALPTGASCFLPTLTSLLRKRVD